MSRVEEQAAAIKLVAVLLTYHGLEKSVTDPVVYLAKNFKITFLFKPAPNGQRPSRYGYRPGLEIEWKKGRGDVDAWNPKGGDLLSFFGHVGQVFREHLGFNAERPSKLLKTFLSKNPTLETSDTSQDLT